MKIYIYGIIDSGDQIAESIYGMRGATVYNIPYCDIGAVVSEISRPVPGTTKDAVLEHEAVVESLMESFTVLPVRFLTIVDGRNDVLSLLQGSFKDFKDNLERLRNKLEFGIKVIWPADRIRENIIKALQKSEQNIPASDDSPKRKFIKEKFEKYKIDKEFEEKAGRFINAMDIFFSKFAAEKKLEKLKTNNLLLAAVYLVEKHRQNGFKEAFEHVRSAHPCLKYLLSGPWPPYNFVVLPKKPGLLKDPRQAAASDEIIECQGLVGVDNR